MTQLRKIAVIYLSIIDLETKIMKLTRLLPVVLIMFAGTTLAEDNYRLRHNQDRPVHKHYYKQHDRHNEYRHKRIQRERIIRNATSLQRSSWRLVRELRTQYGHRYITRSAKMLAREVGYFRRSVANNRGYSRWQMKRDFWRLKHKFKRLNRALSQTSYRKHNYRRDHYRRNDHRISYNMQQVRRKFFRLQHKVQRYYGYGYKPFYSNARWKSY